MERNLVPSEHVVVTLRVQEYRWLQALEGEINSAHAPILHAAIDAKGEISDWIAARDLPPMFQCERQDFGVSIAARRRPGQRDAVLAGQPVRRLLFSVTSAGRIALNLPE
jgi:phthalate 4,5-dioxygenase